MMAPETLVAMIILAALAFVLGFLGGVAFAADANGQIDEDVKPIIRGEWITEKAYQGNIEEQRLRCSNCGNKMVIPRNFCPNCGADMRKEGDENDGKH